MKLPPLLKNSLCLLCLSLLLITVPSCKDTKNLNSGQEVTLTGTLRIVGNEPVTKFVLTYQEMDVIIIPHSDLQVQNYYQKVGQRMTLTGTVYLNTLTTADQKHTSTEYYLKVHPE